MSSVSPTEHCSSWEPQGDSAHWRPVAYVLKTPETRHVDRRQTRGPGGRGGGLSSESDAREQDLGTSGSMPTVPRQLQKAFLELPLKQVI